MRRAIANQIGRLFGDHDDGRVDVAADKRWHHGCIAAANGSDAANAEFAVDHRHLDRLRSDPASTKGLMLASSREAGDHTRPGGCKKTQIYEVFAIRYKTREARQPR
jgi:hypothetical protein